MSKALDFRSKGIERERKFLVQEPPHHIYKYSKAFIRQGYISIDENGTEVRLRELRGQNPKSRRHVMTIKSGKGEQRKEEEFNLPQPRFIALWPMTRGRRIEKARYRIPHQGGLTIELDVYRGTLKGLVVAEVEFQSFKQARLFQPPTWFGRELTKDSGYSNKNLARCGLPGQLKGQKT